MSASTLNLTARLDALKSLRGELVEIRKSAFMAAPPMPQAGGAPPMDPAMAQQGMMPFGMDPAMMGGMPPQDPAMMGGGAPVDPATGMPMDPAMMGGMPMDPAMMGGMPMDPAMMGGMPPQDPAAGGEGGITPEMLDELLGVIEDLAAGQEELGAGMQQIQQAVEATIEEVEDLKASLTGAAPAGAEYGM